MFPEIEWFRENAANEPNLRRIIKTFLFVFLCDTISHTYLELMSCHWTSGNLWNEDVLYHLCNHLNQKELHSASLTCKLWNKVANRRLYSHIYISESPSQKHVTQVLYEDWPIVERPSIVRNDLRNPNCTLKLLENSLLCNVDLADLVHFISISDLAFILFKLKSWGLRLFSKRLRFIRLCDLPLQQIALGFDCLMSFYKIETVMDAIQEVHVEGFKDFIQLVTHADNIQRQLRISSLFIYSCDDDGMNVYAKSSQVMNVLGQLKRLSVCSNSQVCLQVFSRLRETYGDGCLSNIEVLSFLHFHMTGPSLDHQSQKKLALTDISALLGIELLKSLIVNIGCQICFQSSLHGSFNPDERPQCDCLQQFFEELLDLVLNCSSIERISIKNLQNKLQPNLTATFHFKILLSDFLESINLAGISLKLFALNTSCELALPDTVPVPFLVDRMNTVNETLMFQLSQLEANVVAILDYFESFLSWSGQYRSKDSGVHFLSTHCEECKKSSQKMEKFITVNSNIQFYLNPIYKTTLTELRYNLLQSLLQILNCPSFARFKFNQNNRNVPSSNEINQFISNNNGSQIIDQDLLLDEDLSLHHIFRHNDYKRMVERPSREFDKVSEVCCDCDGYELATFAQSLRHVLEDSKLSNGHTTILNGFKFETGFDSSEAFFIHSQEIGVIDA